MEFIYLIEKHGIVSQALLNSLENPDLISSADKSLHSKTESYPVKTLFDIAEFLIKANDLGYLGFLEVKYADSAKKIIRLNNEVPLKEFIRQESGLKFYNLNLKLEIANLMILQQNDPCYHWVRCIPDEIFDLVLKMNGTHWLEVRNHLTKVTNFLEQTIFCRLSAKTIEMIRSTRPKREYWKKDCRSQPISIQEFRDFLVIWQNLALTSGLKLSVLLQLLDKCHPINKKQFEFKIAVAEAQLSPKEILLKELIFN